jgi:signal transduction histidine kinase
MKLQEWIQSSLSQDDYAEFLRETYAKEKSDLLGVTGIGSIVFIMWGIIDFMFAPSMWEHLLLYRCAIVVPYMTYNVLVARGVLKYGSLTKYLNSLPAAILISWITTVVQDQASLYYAVALVLIILATGPSRLWLPHEFLTQAAILYASSAIMWFASPSLTLQQSIFMHAMVLTAMVASFGSAVAKHSQMSLMYWQKGEQVRRDREVLEERLAESAKAGFLADHLGLFLHDVKNVLYHLELLSDAVKKNHDKINEFIESLDDSSRFTRTRIESFLAQVTTGEVKREQLSIRKEIASMETIAQYEVRHKPIRIHFDYGNLTPETLIDAMRGTVPSILFNIIRNSIDAIQRKMSTGREPSNMGFILVKTTVASSAVILTIEDNGDAVSEGILEDFKAGRLIPSSHHGGRAGLGTYAMRLQAKALGAIIEMAPKASEGTVVRLTIPLLKDATDDPGIPDQAIGS